MSDPDHILDIETVFELNNIALSIDSLTGAEFTIVVVNDYKGESDFEFAKELFMHWQIGKQKADNGLLLFIAMDRHEYRFISGYGMEGILPDVYLSQIAEKYLKPHFQAADYNTGLLETAKVIGQALKSPNAVAELKSIMPEAQTFWERNSTYLLNSLGIIFLFILIYKYCIGVQQKTLKEKKKKEREKRNKKKRTPFITGFFLTFFILMLVVLPISIIREEFTRFFSWRNLPYLTILFLTSTLTILIKDGVHIIRGNYPDKEDQEKEYRKYISKLIIPIVLTPFIWIPLRITSNRFKRDRIRFLPPDDSGNWERIKRSLKPSQISEFLDKGQLKEEKIKSRSYEIWRNTKDKSVKLIPWQIDDSYEECTECHYYTLQKNLTKEIRKPTGLVAGEGQKYDQCSNCGYFKSIEFYPIYESRSSSGGGSFGSSGGGGGYGGGGGGGSFGGGSTGGGGAGGSW